MQGYVPAGDKAFAESWECFSGIVSWASSEEAAGLQHADLEEQLEDRGRKLLRQLFQDRLDLTASQEERRHDVTGADGAVRTRAERGRTRPLMTVFGQVTVSRIAYRSPGRSNVHPADAALNLPEEKHSHGLRKLAAAESARGSMEDAGAAITRATGVKIGKRQVEALARRAAAHVEEFYAWRRLEDPPEEGCPLILTFDGKGIVMLPGALRPATAKAAETAENKLATRLSPGEKHGRKRMAEVAGVYDAVPVQRTPEDVISTPAQKRKKRKQQPAKPKKRGKPPEPQARNKWLTASVTDDIPAVVAVAFDEAERRDPDRQREWAVLIDGNNTQIEAVTAEAAKRGVQVTIVIDFVHVAEYAWKAAWSFFDKGEPAAEERVAAQLRKILNGKSAQVAAGIRRRATAYGYSGPERAGADECARYLDNKRQYLGYDSALAKGWPIATGIVEGACRHIVKDRMDITGARWSLEGAEAILKLRALTANGDFEDYWTFHLRREHERIHHAKYRGSQILAA
ncbi:MAG TPA: ISKra4 family transposase [Streptosporangiaceae bacterium]|nr:ISKra4 family transposase [Streptosporangiaceae bacterium]HYA50336.1 ISKra4 family transposase [Streptosporangiaceae bacterium]